MAFAISYLAYVRTFRSWADFVMRLYNRTFCELNKFDMVLKGREICVVIKVVKRYGLGN